MSAIKEWLMNLFLSFLEWVLGKFLGTSVEDTLDPAIDVSARLKFCKARLMELEYDDSILGSARRRTFRKLRDDYEEEFYAKRRKAWQEDSKIPSLVEDEPK